MTATCANLGSAVSPATLEKRDGETYRNKPLKVLTLYVQECIDVKKQEMLSVESSLLFYRDEFFVRVSRSKSTSRRSPYKWLIHAETNPFRMAFGFSRRLYLFCSDSKR
jgi:hypothetical protein